MTPIDFVINDASYRPHLYLCDPNVDPVSFKFSSGGPPTVPIANCQLHVGLGGNAKTAGWGRPVWCLVKVSM